MKIILKADVAKVGKKGQLVEVADGYGRNYLIRNGLGVLATAKSVEVLSEQKAEDAKQQQLKKEQAQSDAKKLADITLHFSLKAGKDDKVFGSVSNKMIAEALALQYGIEIDKRKILDFSPLNQLGENNVRIELYKDVIGELKVILEAKE